MAITKLQDLIAKIDCPYCFSLLTWDSIQDVQIVNGNKAIICPICGETIQLDRKKDYWYESISDGGGIITETDPTVPRWAKQPNKPTYTADQINFVYEQDGQSETIPVDQALESLIDYINSNANNISILESTVNDLSTKIFDQIVINVTDVNTQNQTITISPNDATLLDIANLLRASKSEYITIKTDGEFCNINNYSVNLSNNQSSDFLLQLSSNYIDYTGASIFYGYLQSSNGELSFSQESNYIPTSDDIDNWNSKTSNIGTVTSVAVNGSTYQPDSNGSVDLGSISGDQAQAFYRTDYYNGVYSFNAKINSVNSQPEVGPKSFAIGEQASATGSYCYALGDQAKANGQINCFAIGNLADAGSNDTIALGNNSSVTGNSSIAIGHSAQVPAIHSYAIGQGIYTDTAYAITLGFYNSKANYIEDGDGDNGHKGTKLLKVGNGTSASSRSTAFTIDWSGNIWAKGKMTVGAGPTNNMDVATKQYVDEAIATAIANLNN